MSTARALAIRLRPIPALACAAVYLAGVLFLVLKAFNAVFNKKKEEAEEAPAEPTTKVCPYCQSEISIKAVRCPQCTSKLEGFPEISD